MFKRKGRNNAEGMTIVGHLTELRQRLIAVVVTLIGGALAGFYFSGRIIDFLLEIPQELVYLYPGEAFFAHLKIALILGVIIACPMILFQFVGFILPALQKHEKKTLFLTIPFIIFLFFGGVIFAYTIILPLAYRFFMEFGTQSLTPLISINNYVSFVIGLVLPFGLLFQMPVLVMMLTAIGILTPQFLSRYRKIMVLLVLIMAALLTPPDIVSQLLMAGPMFVLYEFSIMIAKIVFRKRQRRL